MIEVIRILGFFILVYFIILNSFYIVLLFFSIRSIIFGYQESGVSELSELFQSKDIPPVTIIIPAYNEKKDVFSSIYSVLNNSFSSFSLIIVNDGSSDNTLSILMDELSLIEMPPIFLKKINTVGKIRHCYFSEKYKNITVIDKEHTDKSDSLNVAVNVCQTPFFITIDADTLIEKEAINEIMFTALKIKNVASVGGNICVLNGCQYREGGLIEKNISWNPLCMVQTFEYLRAFLYARLGFNLFEGALCFAGAFTLFNRESVIKLGGFDLGNVAQDFEIITHLHAYLRRSHSPYKMRYTAVPTVWTNVPCTLYTYCRQRINWQYGTLKSLMKHKYMLFNPKYGIVGMLTYPYFLFGEALSAIVEFLSYLLMLVSWILGVLDIKWVVLFLLLSWGFVGIVTMATTLLSLITFNKYKKLSTIMFAFFAVIIETFGLRQLYVLSRLIGTVKYCFYQMSLLRKGKSEILRKK